MYNTLKTLIPAGGYRLSQMQKKIKKLYLLGDLDEKQTDELLSLAAAKISVDSERPSEEEMLVMLAARVSALETKIAELVGSDEGQGTSEYPSWTPWDGLSENYAEGAVVSHKGTLWRSVYHGQNVWEPGAQGTEALWVLHSVE